MKALGLVVSEKKIFLYFHHDAHRAGPVWTTGARLAGFIKRKNYILLQTKYETSGSCSFGEEDFFLNFHHDAPRAGPVWTTGARLAGFIKRNTIYCYKQNMKALGLVVSEKKIFFMFYP